MLPGKQFQTFQENKGSVKPKHEVEVLTIVLSHCRMSSNAPYS